MLVERGVTGRKRETMREIKHATSKQIVGMGAGAALQVGCLVWSSSLEEEGHETLQLLKQTSQDPHSASHGIWITGREPSTAQAHSTVSWCGMSLRMGAHGPSTRVWAKHTLMREVRACVRCACAQHARAHTELRLPRFGRLVE